jgi:TetR/AcrR family transcriptional regulator, cholesterol catabolism regulator
VRVAEAERGDDGEVGPPDVASLTDAQRARRERIVEAAIDAMLSTEYSQIQMRDVTASAGVALGTTYRYFASKNHLLAEALLSWASRFPSFEVERAGGRSVEHLQRAYRLAVRAFEPHPTVYETMMILQGVSEPRVEAIFREFARRQTEAFSRSIPRIASPRRDDVVMVMGAVLDNQLRRWAKGEYPIEEVYRAVDVTAELLLGD